MSFLKADKLEKINDNNQRIKYLKTFSLSCLIIDLISFTTLETINLIFSDIEPSDIVFYASKVNLLLNRFLH